LQVDTSTGSFGYSEPDLTVQGALPLSLTRYYAGQSDHLGRLGYHWSTTYDTRLIPDDGNDGCGSAMTGGATRADCQRSARIGASAFFSADGFQAAGAGSTCVLGSVRPRVTAPLDTAIDGCIQLCIDVKASVPVLCHSFASNPHPRCTTA
jgi:hypothetical protein